MLKMAATSGGARMLVDQDGRLSTPAAPAVIRERGTDGLGRDEPEVRI